MDIFWDASGSASMKLPCGYAEENGIIDKKPITFKFGGYERILAVEIDHALEDNQMMLPAWMQEEVELPEVYSYAVQAEGGQLRVGPIIAFMAFGRKDQITPERLERFRYRFARLQDTQGLVYVCAADSLLPEGREVEGYLYQERSGEGEAVWVKKRLPSPDAVFKRVVIGRSQYGKWAGLVGAKRIFNQYPFDKLTFWRKMRSDPRVRRHLPYTEQLTGQRKQVDRLLRSFGRLYLKPAHGSQGNGIYVIEKVNRRYAVQNRDWATTKRMTPVQLHALLKKLKAWRVYLIQQSLQLNHGERMIDYRAYMQKDAQARWVCQGVIGRMSKKGSVVTNLKYMEELMYAEEAIQQVFNTRSCGAALMVRNIAEVCIRICSRLDRLAFGLYGDLGIDLVVDRQGKVWILELNKQYNWKSLLLMKDTRIRPRLVTTPFEYAAALAGFASSLDVQAGQAAQEMVRPG